MGVKGALLLSMLTPIIFKLCMYPPVISGHIAGASTARGRGTQWGVRERFISPEVYSASAGKLRALLTPTLQFLRSIIASVHIPTAGGQAAGGAGRDELGMRLAERAAGVVQRALSLVAGRD